MYTRFKSHYLVGRVKKLKDSRQRIFIKHREQDEIDTADISSNNIELT